MRETDSNGKTRYYNIKSAVIAEGNSQILNSHISGGRAAVYLVGGELLIDNSTIEGGAAANIHIEAAQGLTLRDVTLIQEPKQATVHDKTKTLMGLSVIAMCDGNGLCTPITLEGTLRQYAWACEEYKQYVPSDGQSLVSDVLKETDYLHNITYSDGETRDSLNLGFLFMPSGSTSAKDPVANNVMIDQRTEREDKPYGSIVINSSAYVYSYSKANGTAADMASKPGYSSNAQTAVRPVVLFEDVNEERIFETEYNSTTGWTSTLTVDVDAGAYTFTFDKLLAEKFGQNLNYTVQKANGTAVDKAAAIVLNDSSTTEYVLTITDDQIYDENGNSCDTSVKHTHTFMLLASKTSLPAPTWESTTLTGTPYIVVDTKDGDWNCAVPVLDGLKVKYWSKSAGAEKSLPLSDIIFSSVGPQNGSNNTLTIESKDDYTLTITTTGFKTNDNGKPVVVNVNGVNKLYFTVSSSSNYVSTKTTDRTVTIQYTFQDANNTEPLTLTTSMTVTYATYKSTQYAYGDFCKGTLTEASCVVAGTLITMADGTQKAVEDLQVGDMLLVFNHVSGKLEAAPLIFNTHDNANAGYYDVLKLQFSDGDEVKIVSSHGFFDMTLMQYVYITDSNYAEFIGHDFYSLGEDGVEIVTLTEAVIEKEYTRVFCPVTYFHMNSFANGMLNTPNIPGGITGLVNYFEYDPDLKYNEEAMQRDIEKYGLYTYDDFKDYISEEAYHSSPSVYLKVAVGKGMITFEQILDVIYYLLEGSLIS